MLSNTTKKLFQPKWPLKISSLEGPYESVASAKESMIQNFVFLLRTIPGEWPMDPALGVGLERYLFENFNSPELGELKSRIEEQLKVYLPEIILVEAEFVASKDNMDSGSTSLLITFFIKFFDQPETISINIDNEFI